MRKYDDPMPVPTEHGNAAQNAATDLRVLVIEDDNADFFAIRRLLKKASDKVVTVTHVSDYENAIIALGAGEHDVALVDYFIGKYKADQMLREIGDALRMPVIVLTGSDDTIVQKAVLESGAFDYLDKNTVCGAALNRSVDFAIKRFETERAIRAHNEELQRAFENAEAAHFSKSEFLAFLSCELRTPLNAVLGFSQVMKLQDESMATVAGYRQYSEIIHDSGLQLLNLVDDLLDMSETDTDAFDARQRRFKRFRTWIVDKQDARDAHDTHISDETSESTPKSRPSRSMVGCVSAFAAVAAKRGRSSTSARIRASPPLASPFSNRSRTSRARATTDFGSPALRATCTP